MTKFNVEIDLDWIDEDSSVDEMIKHEIISRVESKVAASLLESVKKQTEEKVAEKIDGMVSEEITARIATFLESPRNITDEYGDIIKKDVTVESLLKERIEGFIDKKTVDENGRTPSYSSHAKYTDLEYFAVKTAKEMVDNFTKTYAKDTEETIKNMVQSKIKTEVADKLTNLIVNNSSSLSLDTSQKAS